MKYKVKYKYEATAVVIVEADSEANAMEAGLNEADEIAGNNMNLSDWHVIEEIE